MFKLLKRDPTKKLQREFENLSEKAMDAQRNGNIELFAKLSKEAEEIGKQIDKLREENK